MDAQLEADVAALHAADNQRRAERRADKWAGKVLAVGRRAENNPSLTPKDMVESLRPPKGQPAWTPFDIYDQHRDRRQTIWKGYVKELRGP